MTLHTRLRAMAARACSARTMELLIDPVLTDVENEHQNAVAQGRLWRSRWIRAAGYFAFLKVIALCAYERTVRDWSVDDCQALARTVGLSTLAFVVAASLLISPTLPDVPTNLLLYQLPQALPLAIPVGITIGIFGSLSGGVVPFRLKVAVLAFALSASAVSLATTVWLIPAAGQAFRASLSEHVRLTAGKEVTPTIGAIELPLSELRTKIDALTQSGRARAARSAAFGYYIRWALPCAPIVLALFALSVMSRLVRAHLRVRVGPVRRWIVSAGACGACLSYYLLLLAADIATRQTPLPIAAIAASVWLPNLTFTVASAALMVTATRSRFSA